MKRKSFFIFLFWLITVCAFSQTTVSLGEAIRTASAEISVALDAGTTIAVVDFSSSSVGMSDHLLGEVTSALVNARVLDVVGRGADMALARRELEFNLTGDVSDASAQRVGRNVGAQAVVSGSLRITGAYYSFRIQVMEVETLRIPYSKTFNVLNDSQISTLLGEEALVANFTPGERVGTAALNLALGLGSFAIQKDPFGGGVTAALETLGAAAVIVSFFQVKESWKTDPWTGEQYIDKDTSISTPLLIGGLAAYAGGAVFGAIRAFSYRKPGVNVAEAPSPWNIALVPTADRNTAVRLSYTMRF